MQQTLRYMWVNVFTTEQDKGNPLPVFLLDSVLSDQSMQQIAAMFNQSETVFITDYLGQMPQIRLFTPAHELPFAGHPLIGSIAALQAAYPDLVISRIEVPAGVVETRVDEEMDIVWLKTPKAPQMRDGQITLAQTSAMLGLPEDKIKSLPVWVNVGSEQLLVEVSDFAAVDAIQLDASLMAKHASLYPGREITYVWAKEGNEAYVHFMYLQNGAVLEDPGTGSACANLGGLHLLQQKTPLACRVRQGVLLGRENVLYLEVNQQDDIWIGGQNRLMGEGQLIWNEN